MLLRVIEFKCNGWNLFLCTFFIQNDCPDFNEIFFHEIKIDNFVNRSFKMCIFYGKYYFGITAMSFGEFCFEIYIYFYLRVNTL